MKKLMILNIVSLLVLTGCERISSQEQSATIKVEKDDNLLSRTANLLEIPLHSEINSTETVCILVRHAEKVNYGTDPDLSAAGKARAEELKRLLFNADIDNIYTTPFKRTRQTVGPLAESKGISVKEYSAYDTTQTFISKVLAQNKGKIVVIVGHSNTIPDMIKILSNNTVSVTISESQFDNIFITKNSEKAGSLFVNQGKYGQSTP